MKEIENKDKKAQDILSEKSEFKGYTIEEIKFQRALVAMQAEFCKTRFLRSWSHIQKANPLSPSSSNSFLPAKAGSLAFKMINGLNYLDYIMLGLSAFNGIRKVTSFFRGKKK